MSERVQPGLKMICSSLTPCILVSLYLGEHTWVWWQSITVETQPSNEGYSISFGDRWMKCSCPCLIQFKTQRHSEEMSLWDAHGCSRQLFVIFLSAGDDFTISGGIILSARVSMSCWPLVPVCWLPPGRSLDSSRVVQSGLVIYVFQHCEEITAQMNSRALVNRLGPTDGQWCSWIGSGHLHIPVAPQCWSPLLMGWRPRCRYVRNFQHCCTFFERG